jgi:ceramide glucosyltransferase
MDNPVADVTPPFVLLHLPHLPLSAATAVALVLLALAAFGLLQGVFGLAFLARFLRRARRMRARAQTLAGPAISVLKPLHGDEPLLEEALTSFFVQDYPAFQLVLGVQTSNDPAIAVVERLRARFPACDVSLVIDATQHGKNRKISNLINMMEKARHDLLVVADSDIHAAQDYLGSVQAMLATPGTRMVTTLYTGLAADRSLAARIGASQINHAFIPGVLIGRALGREDGLGATMALTRETLARVGGFAALADHIADDAVLAVKVRELGLAVRLAPSIPATTVAERGLRDLCRRELRWARVNRSLAPLSYAASVVQYPLAFALMTLALAPGAAWAWGWLGFCWLLRGATARGIDHALALAPRVPLALLPLRDLLSVVSVVMSFAGDKVYWRGEVVAVEPPPRLSPKL